MSAVMIATLLLWVCTPALACLASPEKMTDSEMQCCREMAGNCGEMVKSEQKAEHSCCPKSPVKAQSDKTVLAAAEKYTAPVLAVSHVSPLPGLAAVASDPARAVVSGAAESPPGAPLPLRI